LRAEAEHLKVEFVVGDTEKLPFPDKSFDAVTSIYGSMFAPNHTKAAGEIARVCKPGGRIALASWTPEGYVGQMFKLFSSFVPPPAGVQPPPLWGTEPHPQDDFRELDQVDHEQRASGDHAVPLGRGEDRGFRAYFGPTVRAFAALPPEKQEETQSAMDGPDPSL